MNFIDLLKGTALNTLLMQVINIQEIFLIDSPSFGGIIGFGSLFSF